MSIPFKRITWNEYEIALLVNLYDVVQSGHVSRNVGVKKMSARLRAKFIKNGIEINDKYRNFAGINLQLYSIDRYINGKDNECQAISKKFEKVIDLRFNDIKAYKELLCEAAIMYPDIVEDNVTKTDFNASVLSTESKKAVEDFKIREILQRIFFNGYRLESNMDFKRFVNSYKETYNEEFVLDNISLCNEMSSICVRYKEKLYLIETLVNLEVKEKLFAYIESTFNSGVKYIYYSKLYERFSEDFIHCKIYDCCILRSYLEYFNNLNKYMFYDAYLSKDHFVILNNDTQVIDYIKEQGKSVSLNEVLSALSFLPDKIIRKSFANNKDVLLVSGRDERFHIDNFQLEHDDKQLIIEYLTREIERVKFIGFPELIDKMLIITPRVLVNNSQFTNTGIRSALSLLLKDHFNFRGGIVSDINTPISMQDIFVDFASGRDSFDIEEVQKMSEEFNTLINFEVLLLNHTRVSYNLYVSKNNISLCADDIDDAIDKYFKSEYISISDIDTYVVFPECEYNWNEFLLESYLHSYSKVFKLLHNRFNKTSVSGVIVRKDSQFNNYNDVLVIALANTSISLDDENLVLNYLYDNGLIGRRQLDGVEQLINRAKQLKRN